MTRRTVGPEINQPDRRAPLFVGRDPGATEIDEGQPFVGPAGRVLFGGYDNLTGGITQGALAQAGLKREDVNITNRVHKKPWNNDFYRHSWDDIKQGKRDLLGLIEDLDPSVIVATGNEAAYDLVPGWRSLTDRPPDTINTGGASIKSAKGVLDRRGFFWYDHDLPTDAPVLVTLHPSSCLYQAMPNRMLLDIDMARLGAELRGELPRRPWPEATRITTEAQLAPLWEADLVAYDIEVKWGGAEFLCIAFYTSDGDAFLAYSDGLGACEEWLRSDRPKLAHNGQFDRYFLDAKLGIKPGGRHEDTIIGHWACYPELAGKADTGRETQNKDKNEMTRKGLNFLASFHLNVGWWKTYTSNPRRMGELCVNDVAATLWSWEVVEPEIDRMDVRWQYERQLDKIPALIWVQKRGMLIDEDMRSSRLEELGERQGRLEARSTEAAEAFLREHEITHDEDGEELWWYHDAQCPCCNGGAKKRLACDSCAGIEGSGSGGAILKDDLVLWAWRSTDRGRSELKGLTKDELTELLPECKECDGEGTIPEWGFNVMSPTQMPALLWDHLDVPMYTCNNTPDATAETLKRVLEWAMEQKP